MTQVEVRPSGDRFVTHGEGRMTTHAFSFGDHYDPDNIAFGPLIAHNDEVLDPGGGYPEHAHHDVELVTVVLTGAVHHRDSDGGEDVLPAGAVQVHSAGAGLTHSEYADPGAPTRFVQSWLRPDVEGTEPRRSVAHPELGPEWTALAGGAGLPLGCASATLWRARPAAGDRLALPPGDDHQLYVLGGAVALGEHGLGPGDEARVTGAHDADLAVEAGGDSDVLCWSLTPAR